MLNEHYKEYLLLFFVGLCTDIIWTLYIHSISHKKALQASVYSVLSGICTVAFVNGLMIDVKNCIPWLIGMALGTYLMVRLNNNRKNNGDA
jgi:uncharacterized membrane protein